MEEVKFTIDDLGVATIILDNPKKRNVLSSHIMHQLESALLKLSESDTNAKALIVRSKYPEFFSAGGDVQEWYSYEKEKAYIEGYKGGKIFDLLERLPFVTIAAISGSCLGGGCELALACDLRVSTEDATFGQPEILLGNGPSWGGYYRLIRTVGYTKAKEMILLGETYSAYKANSIGLVNRITSDWEQLLQTVSTIATKATKNQNTAAISKLILNQLGQDLLPTNLMIDAHSAAYFAGTETSKVRKQAFLEKRLNEILM
ncbi:enoyl-CoA hydratase/isomerase family protein [Priestia megaterium]|uniref:enoyl-CoA hydratase/isomerase family protein n=1 Tax=Priestia megaterium TaxID=1404 RepID=UPI003396EEAF